MTEFDFLSYKKQLFLTLLDKNKKESHCFDDLIKNYNNLYANYKKLSEKFESIERENFSLKKFGKFEYKTLFINRTTDTGRTSSSNISGGSLSALNNNELQIKIQQLEKELNEKVKELSNNSGKLVEFLTENMKMKEQIEQLTSQNNSKQTRIIELEQIVKEQDDEIIKLREHIDYLRKDNSVLEKQNMSLNDNLNKKVLENNALINEILKLKQEYMEKMNEMIELYENAKKKKEAADIYFNEKKKEYEEEVKINIDKQDFQVFVEDVLIPNKLKMKAKGHKKNITSIKYNNFGTNFLTSGSDAFIKLWDSVKMYETGVFAGFSTSVSSATFDNAEQMLFAGSLDKTAKLWELKNNKLKGTFTGHIDYINTVATYYSSSRGLTGSSDRTIKEWDFQTLKLSKTYNCVSSCFALAVSYDDDFIVSGHLDGGIKIWSDSVKPDHQLDYHDDRINSIELIKNQNQILTSSKDFTIKLFDLRKMEPVYTINENILKYYCDSNISVSSDKKYFAVGSTKGEIYIFNLKTGELEKVIDNKSTSSITAIQWRSYHSQLLVGDAFGTLTLWGAN